MRPLTLVALLAGALLAGCSAGDGDGAAKPGDGPSAQELGLQATASTGLVRGVVVDDAIRPLANVTVTLQGVGGAVQRTDPTGAFGFDGLQPGTYFVKATKLGYFDSQQSAEVVAGVTEPPAVKIQLAVDASFRAYFEVQVYEGFIECTTSFLVLCGAPNTIEPIMCSEFGACYGNVTNDRFTFTQFFQANATMVQTELVWQTNQAASPELTLSAEALTADCKNTDLSTVLNHTTGPSPIHVRVHDAILRDYEIGPRCGVYFSIFAGDATGDPTGQDIPLGVTVEQRFTAYTHAFYGYMPPAGWRFSDDDTVPMPPQ